MRARRRQSWFSVACLAIGLTGLACLVLFFRSQPWARKGLWLFLAYQSFWWAVRAWLVVGIWRRERAIGPALKLWLGLTVPLPGLVAVYAGRGKLSAWLTAEEPCELGSETVTFGGADPDTGPENGPAG